MKFEIKEGQSKFLFAGVTNIAELREFATEKSEEYKDIQVTEANIKLAEKDINELKPYRTKVKKYRAALNKELKSRVAEKLEEVDDITSIFNEVIEPVEKKIEEYREAKRIKRLADKKAKFQPEIDKINHVLSQAETLFVEVEMLEFAEDWANKKDEDIIELLNKFVDETENKLAFYKARIEAVETNCKLFKSEYDLAGEINWKVLGRKIYDDNYKDLLDDLAGTQQEQEVAAAERAEKEAIRAAEKAEAERIRKENEAIRKAEVEKEQKAELERLEKEREQQRKQKEKKKELARQKLAKKKKVKFEMNLTKLQAENLKEYLFENQIDYIVI
jgi:hypothetical protein